MIARLASHVPPVDISYPYVVWIDCRDDPTYPNEPTLASELNVYMYNIEMESEERVTDVNERIGAVQVYGSNIYFLMKDNYGIWSVFEKGI